MSGSARVAGRVAALPLVLVALLAGCSSPAAWLDAEFEAALQRADAAAPDTPLPGTPTLEPEGHEATRAGFAPLIDVPAQGPVPVTVEQAVVAALQRNADLAVQRLNPVIAGTFADLERGLFDPEVFVELDYEERVASEISRATGGQFSVENDFVGGVAGLRQRLPTGTDVEVVTSQGRETSNRSPEQQEARVGITVTQALLRGAGLPVNLAAVRQAELDERASRFEFRGFAEALLAEAERTYWSAVLAQERIAVFENALELARQQLGELETRIEIGTLAPADAAVGRAELALREQALIDARSALVAERFRLLRLVNLDPAGDLAQRLELTSEATVDPAPLDDVEDRLALAVRQRPDLAEARLRLAQQRLETIVTRNGLLPRLNVFVNLGKTGFDDTFPGSYRNLDGDTYDLAAGVRFSQLLGNRAAEAVNTAAYASRRQAALAVENLEQLARLDVRLAANEVERARQQIAASRATRGFQEAVVEAERERFSIGTGTALLVAQAQRDLLESRLAETDAVILYRTALIDLYLAEGTLLERRGITVHAE